MDGIPALFRGMEGYFERYLQSHEVVMETDPTSRKLNRLIADGLASKDEALALMAWTTVMLRKRGCHELVIEAALRDRRVRRAIVAAENARLGINPAGEE